MRSLTYIFGFINKKIKYLIFGFILVYTAAAVIVSLNRFWQYQNFYFDLGIFDSAIWQVSRQQLPLVDHIDLSNQKIIIFADHFNPSIFLISPFYWLTDKTEMLLVVQSLAVGLSALFAYFIALKLIRSKLAIFALIVAFLGYVGLQNAIISDFHEATVAVLPLTVIFWAIIHRKWKLYFILLVILLGFKESFAGLGIGLGLYLLIRDRKNWMAGAITIILSFVWGFLTIKFIIPYFSEGVYLYTPKELPQNLNELVSRFTEPALTRSTIFFTYLSFGFLPIFDLSIFPAVFGNFFERFVLSASKGRDLGMHYNAVLSPILFMGSLHIFAFMEKHNLLKRVVCLYSIFIIATVIILHRFILHGPLGLVYNPVFYEQNQRVKYVDDFVKYFPKQGVIMTQNDLAVRLTHYDVRLLRENYYLINPDHIIFNLTSGQNPNSFFPLTYERAVDLKNILLEDESYRVEKFADELYIFSKL